MVSGGAPDRVTRERTSASERAGGKERDGGKRGGAAVMMGRPGQSWLSSVVCVGVVGEAPLADAERAASVAQLYRMLAASIHTAEGRAEFGRAHGIAQDLPVAKANRASHEFRSTLPAVPSAGISAGLWHAVEMQLAAFLGPLGADTVQPPRPGAARRTGIRVGFGRGVARPASSAVHRGHAPNDRQGVARWRRAQAGRCVLSDTG